MAEYTSMNPKLHQLYHSKPKEISSLRTDDIIGARPKKFNYGRNDIVQKYNDARNQAPYSQEPKSYNYWMPNENQREQTIPQNLQPSPYPVQRNIQPGQDKVPTNPLTFQPSPYPVQKNIQAQNYRQATNPITHQGYENDKPKVNQMRNPMFASSEYGRNSAGPAPGEPIQDQRMFKDSLDALNYQYGGKAPLPVQMNPQMNQEDDRFNQNLMKFFGAETQQRLPSSQTRGVTNTLASNPIPSNRDNDLFEKNRQLFFGIDGYAKANNSRQNEAPMGYPRENVPNNNRGNDPFEKNKQLFFGVDSYSEPVQQMQRADNRLNNAPQAYSRNSVNAQLPVQNGLGYPQGVQKGYSRGGQPPMQNGLGYPQTQGRYDPVRASQSNAAGQDWQFKKNLDLFFA